MSYGSTSEEYSQKYQNTSYTLHGQSKTNRFIYIKQDAEKSSHNPTKGSQKVLLNPHFKTNKVFVNPKFSVAHSNTIHVNPLLTNIKLSTFDKRCLNDENLQKNVPLQSTKIHINPKARSVQIPLNITQTSSQAVHINPNFKNSNILNNIILNNTSAQAGHVKRNDNVPSEEINRAIILTKTKLIRVPVVNKTKKIKRRNSVKSKYKIVKSSMNSSSNKNITVKNSTEENKSKNRYRIDHRRKKSLSIIEKNRKTFVYINRFLSISDLAKKHVIRSPPVCPVKNTAVVNINGIVYRKSRTTLRRASVSSCSLKKSPSRTVQISKYKLVKNPVEKKLTYNARLENKHGDCDNNLVSKKFKIVRISTPKKTRTAKVSPRKLRKCNIPCPYYKKYGLCKIKEIGKCFRKHDPDQIALCTRFLQGACIKENCLLSHNVSPEKMPTCKYYLEGSCSRENCPYLHVKISPKAEVCRDFIEGFCKKAAECDKRHQYICPDYEKHGNCLKQRCPYPHGKMVRNYFSNKIKFAKKCSDEDNKLSKNDQNVVLPSTSNSIHIDVCKKNEQVKENQRYYDENKSKTKEITNHPTTSGKIALESVETNDELGKKSTTKNFIGLQSRPKLGSLPAFIPFGI